MSSEAPKVLISKEEIDKRIIALGKTITEDYKDKEFICIGIMKGAFMFIADLVRNIDLPMNVQFMTTASYDGKNAGCVKLVQDLRCDIKNKHVLLVEDMIDTGNTIKFLLELLQAREPASLSVCSLMQKNKDKTGIVAKYVAFEMTRNEFVVGYGMDFDGMYRNLPYIGFV